LDEIRFIDKFSGIGGFRRGLELSGGYRCVWSNDFNKYANQVYLRHWPDSNHNSGDIRRVDTEEIPDHDLLCAGFPCQTFSVAGKRLGFKETRGTLFFEICRIAEAKRPRLLLLENVKGLLSHEEGRTFATILKSLEELGYWWEYQVLNSKYFGVPQNRERVFIIGHLGEGSTKPVFPITEAGEGIDGGDSAEQVAATLQSSGHASGNYRGMNMILDPYNKAVRIDGLAGTIKTEQGHPTSMGTAVAEPFIQNIPHGYNDGFMKELPSLKSNSGAQYNELLVQPILNPDRGSIFQEGRRVKEVGEPAFSITAQDRHGVLIQLGNIYSGDNPEAGRVFDPQGIAETLKSKPTGGVETGYYAVSNSVDTSGYLRQMGRHEIGKHGLTDYRIRRLTPVECERLQGFPDGWTEGLSDTQRYKCLGNAVTVNVIEFLGQKIKECLS